jgi:hypothetical protein
VEDNGGQLLVFWWIKFAQYCFWVCKETNTKKYFLIFFSPTANILSVEVKENKPLRRLNI